MNTTPFFNFATEGELKDPITMAFLSFHKENPHVYRMFRKFALQATGKRKRFSARTIVEVMRWNTSIVTDDPEGFKINDHWIPYYSRMFERELPQWKGFFERRGSVVDDDLSVQELDELIRVAGG